MKTIAPMTPQEKYEKYSQITKPPVIEAVIDITTLPISLENLNEIKIDGVDGIFPAKENIQNFEVEFRSDGGPSSLSGSFLGYMYRSANGQEAVQSRLNGFAYNALHPYPSWGQFIEKAMNYWRAYIVARGETKIVKLGLRYINAISFPANFLTSDEAFDICLNVPGSRGFDGIQRFQYGYTVVDRVTGVTATVNFGQQPSAASLSNFVLDIDATIPISTSVLQEADLVQHLSRLRDLKNEIFFGTLSSRMLELYK